MERPSLFAFAGGEPAFQRLATAHHARCLADPELNHPFSCFDAAMDDAGLPADPEFRAAMNAYMRWAVEEVALSHPDGAEGVATGAAMPRWGWDGPL